MKNTPLIEIPAPRAIWLAGEYISPSEIDKEQYGKIMSGILNLDVIGYRKLMSTYTLGELAWAYEKIQTRRHGDRYSEHPKAVSLIGALELGDTSLINTQARILHDHHEDTILKVEYIVELVGHEVGNLVALVSNPDKTGDERKDMLNKKMHYRAIHDNQNAGKIKVSDRIHNLRTHEVRLILDGQMPIEKLTKKILENAKRQIDETHEYIVPIAITQSGSYETLLRDDLRKLEQGIVELQDSCRGEESTIHILV